MPRRGKACGIDGFAPIMSPGRDLMAKGTSMKKEPKKPKKKR
jgi:hypothetical protein